MSAATAVASAAAAAAPAAGGLFSSATLYSFWRRVQSLPGPQKALVVAAVAGVGFVAARASRGGSRRSRRGGADGEKAGSSGSGGGSSNAGGAKRDIPFQIRLKKILQILFRGRGSKRLSIVLAALTVALVARTLLSIQVAVVTGEVAQFLVQGNWEGFLRTVGKFALIGVPAAIVNSALKYFSKTFALQCREKLTEHINTQYIAGVNFYKANHLPASKIDNVDQRVTTDVENFCSELAELYTSIFKPLLDIILNTLRLYTVMGAKASLIWFGYYLFLAQIKRRMLKVLALKDNTKEESKLQGDYRTAHSRLITYAEEIAFFEGAPRELTIISSLARRLFGHSAYVHKLMIVTGVFDSYVNKYGASITGYALLCLPVFFPMDVNKPQTVAERTRGYVLNRQLLMDLATGIGMLLTAGTQVATFAGLTARVSEVLEQVKLLTSDTTANNFKLRANEEKLQKDVNEKESDGHVGTLSAATLTRVSEEWLTNWKRLGEDQRKAGTRIQMTRVPSAYGLAAAAATGSRSAAAASTSLAAAAAAASSGSGGELAVGAGPRGRVMEGANIKMIDVSIVSPDGRLLINKLNIEVPHGTNVMITGPNGCGKSSMFRVLGELWPPYEGTVVKPANSDLVFVPQKPYLVLGTLREQIIYPHSFEEMKRSGVTDDDLRTLLTIVDPAGSILREWAFDDTRDWTTAFSGGQKQRVALARVFYHRPRYAILDECTSAVSSEVEGQIYQTCAKLGITLFTISHRQQLQAYHEFQLRLDGHGGWAYISREQLAQEQAQAQQPAH